MSLHPQVDVGEHGDDARQLAHRDLGVGLERGLVGVEQDVRQADDDAAGGLRDLRHGGKRRVQLAGQVVTLLAQAGVFRLGLTHAALELLLLGLEGRRGGRRFGAGALGLGAGRLFLRGERLGSQPRLLGVAARGLGRFGGEARRGRPLLRGGGVLPSLRRLLLQARELHLRGGGLLLRIGQLLLRPGELLAGREGLLAGLQRRLLGGGGLLLRRSELQRPAARPRRRPPVPPSSSRCREWPCSTGRGCGARSRRPPGSCWSGRGWSPARARSWRRARRPGCTSRRPGPGPESARPEPGRAPDGWSLR